MTNVGKNVDAVVMGCSAGGVTAMEELFSYLNKSLSFPIIIVHHISKDSSSDIYDILGKRPGLSILVAEQNMRILKGGIYIAPPDYHILIEENLEISLSVDEKVNYSRPSIDVLFESASDVYGSKLVGILLTGTNFDGTNGLAKIASNNGYCIAQDPKEAEFPCMPNNAVKRLKDAIQVLTIEQIAHQLNEMGTNYD